MNYRSVRRIIKGFFIVLIVFVLTLFFHRSAAQVTTAQKNILLLNSYHQGFKWTRDETDGILDTLNNGRFNIAIDIEYMDWKNYPSKENIEILRKMYEYKYRDRQFDLILTTDDTAFQFALQNRGRLFPNVPIIFSGVNKMGIREIAEGYQNYTGILEVVDPELTLKMALSVNPEIENVYVVYDNTESGISTGELVLEKIAAYGLKAFPLNDFSFDALLDRVKTLDKDSIVLMTTYFSDGQGEIIDFAYAAEEISKNSTVPVYHLYDMGLGHGAFGGNMLSGWLQGERAANVALRVLEGEDPDKIAFGSAKTTRSVFDYGQLRRFGVPLSKISSEYEIINRPFSFIETYRNLVLIVSFAFVILSSFIFILLFYISKIKRMKAELAESHEELTQIYEELAASDEELRKHYEEVMENQLKLKSTEERLAYLAYHDALTGLPNKLSLYENGRDILPSSSEKMLALLFIDMDNFKYINDTMGHASGDLLIKKTSERLSALLKEGCSLYRLGGDEFVILIQDISDKLDAEIFASHILAGFKEAFQISNSILHTSLSIGIALYPQHGQNFEELLKHADIAMYSAKAAGRNKFIVYDGMLNLPFTERVNIEKHLHAALDRNEFELYFQPQLDLKTKRISGFEALLRWKSPELGYVSPLKFIKVAEDTHLIIPLGTWVLRKACAFLRQLKDSGNHGLTVSVNISMLQIMQTDFIDLIKDTLDYYGLEPEDLELEITETILMESFDNVGNKLEELHNYGVRIALDDFGKGYSSLSYLTHLPISTLKIDKSFVDNIPNEDEGLTRHIVSIGKSMGMIVVAEGVEKHEQLEYLTQHECHKIQGYLFSKPLPEGDIVRLLESHSSGGD